MNIQAAVKGSDQTAQAGLSLSDRTYYIVGNIMSQLGVQWLNERVLDSKQHPRKSKAKDGHQLSRDGPSNRQKNDVKIAPLAVQSTLK